MARNSVVKTRRNIMAQQKAPRHLDTPGLRGNISQTQSLLNVSELETRAKATVKDINELYAALQDLVPKQSNGTPGSQHRKTRGTKSGTDTDTARSSDDWDQPRIRRRYHSEKLPKRNIPRDENLNYVAEKSAEEKPTLENEKLPLEKPALIRTTVENQPKEKLSLEKTLSNERLVASDTEAELGHTSPERKIQRHLSLPAYDEESTNETSNEAESTQKRSRFLIFRRRRHNVAKQNKKPSSSWRSFFSTLSLKRKTKKHRRNKIAQGIPKSKTEENIRNTPKHKAKKNISLPLDEHSPKLKPRLSVDVVDNRKNDNRQSGRKRIAPEPPKLTPVENPGIECIEPRSRKNTMETKSDAVQKKLSIWYKHAVKETNSLVPKDTVRATRSCENLLTDTEIIRKRGMFSSDTDSNISGSDRNRINGTVNKVHKTKVRQTRARRNRRREERARFHSLPNVKLVTRALNEVKNSPLKASADDNTKDELTDDVVNVTITTVKPVEAKLSFGSTLEKDCETNVKLQRDNSRKWLKRQCSKTIRPLQLNLFYSESPSREAVHRSRTTLRRVWVQGQESGSNPHEFAFKIRRSSSRRRKRRSFKRGQTRLPHQSPFYVPPTHLNLTPKSPTEEDLSKSKDSGLGSPDSTYEKRFGTFPVTKRDQPPFKPYSESEDSGWASSVRRLTETTDEAIQTDPVIIMTAVSRVRRPELPHVMVDNNSQSEV